MAYDPVEEVKKGEAAIERALAGEQVWDAMTLEPEIGTVSFISPKTGTEGKGFHDGGGLAHLVAARTAAGEDGAKIARRIPKILAYGRRGPVYGPADGRRLNITYKRHTAVLSLHLDKDRRTWLLTGFRDDPSK